MRQWSLQSRRAAIRQAIKPQVVNAGGFLVLPANGLCCSRRTVATYASGFGAPPGATGREFCGSGRSKHTSACPADIGYRVMPPCRERQSQCTATINKTSQHVVRLGSRRREERQFGGGTFGTFDASNLYRHSAQLTTEHIVTITAVAQAHPPFMATTTITILLPPPSVAINCTGFY